MTRRDGVLALIAAVAPALPNLALGRPRGKLPRIGVLLFRSHPGELEAAFIAAGARKAGVSVQQFEAQAPEATDRAFAAMVAARVEAVALAIDGFFFQEAKRIAELAIRYRLPSMTPQRLQADAGSLMSYGSSLAENYRRAATYVDERSRRRCGCGPIP